jgi:hypothetical protein
VKLRPCTHKTFEETSVHNHDKAAISFGYQKRLRVQRMVTQLTACTNAGRNRKDSAPTEDKVSEILDCAIKEYLENHPNRDEQDPECIPGN